MKSLIYWMILQIVVGIWLLLSPFVIGGRALAANDMIFGAVVIAVGMGVAINEFYRNKSPEEMSEELHMGTHLKSS